MGQNLASNVSGNSNEVNLGICQYVSINCKGSKDPDVYKAICSIRCGAGCELKPFRSSSYMITGELF